MQNCVLHIAVPAPLRTSFDYLPANRAEHYEVGMRVWIPFGRKKSVGIIVGIDNHSDLPRKQLKPILKCLDEQALFSPALLSLLAWSAEYYHHPLGEVLHQAIPVLLRGERAAEIQQETFYQITKAGRSAAADGFTKAPKQWQMLQVLQEHAELSVNTLGLSAHEVKALSLSMPTLKILINKELVKINKSNSCTKNPPVVVSHLVLTPAQEIAINEVWAVRDKFSPFVLQGVTGSGKTEVYLHLVQRLIETGKQALILIPEIGLSPQTMTRFRDRLGTTIGVLHSGLTDRERLDTWLKAKNGELSVIIGTRSAIFTDFNDLGLIVVDEAHDVSYKQWEGFKYHARDLAVRRAQMSNIPVVLGSATPSLGTLVNMWQGHYQCLELSERVTGAQLPRFSWVDCRRVRLQAGLAPETLDQVKEVVKRGEQILFFLNRRGFAPTLMCHECGWVSRCSRCERPMTVHAAPSKLLCHHCEKTLPVPKSCPECKNDSLINLGLGTQQLETVLKQHFPEVAMVRIDRDTTRKKGSLETGLQSITSGQAQILIGTQMLAKGHHFPNVTLVVMLDIDGGLYSVDYAATEQLAQQIIQVAGRAGRAEKPGHVIIQTHHPDHPLLKTIVEQGYSAFARELAQEREATQCPPYRYYGLFRVEAVSKEVCESFLQEVRQILTQAKEDAIKLLGPLPAPIEKLMGRYRWQLLLSAKNRSALHYCLKSQLPLIDALKSSRKVRWSLDIDPIELL